MKLSSVSAINNVKYSAPQKLSQKNNNSNNVMSNSIANNSLQEAIGRSQVSFSGTHDYKNGKFTYTQKSIGSPSENIKYDKETGVMEYYEMYSNGAIKKIIRINPRTQEEFIEETDKEGYTLTTRTSPTVTKIVKKDAQGKICFDDIYNDGLRLRRDYDYALHRIIARYYNGESEKPEIHVLDLASQKEVDSTDTRVLDKQKFRRKGDCFEYRTIDLTNDDIYESRLVDPYGVVIEGYKRSFETGLLTWEAERNGNRLVEKDYDKNGKLATKTITNLSDDSEIIETYGKNETLLSKEKRTYNRNGDVATISEFNLQTNAVEFITTFTKNGIIVDTYKPDGSVRLQTDESDKNGRLFKSTFYYSNGTTPKTIEEYSDVGFNLAPHARKIVKQCNKNGQVKTVSYFDQDDKEYLVYRFENGSKNPYCSEVINHENGRVTKTYLTPKQNITSQQIFDRYGNEISYTSYYPNSKVREYSRRTNRDGSVIETHYVNTGIPITSTLTSRNGDLLESLLYYDDGKSVKTSIKYHRDRSFTTTNYSVDGIILEQYDSWEDGTPKPQNKTRTSRAYSAPQDKELPIEDVVKNICSVIGSKQRSRADVDIKQWAQFARYLGLNDVNQLFEMEKTVYRELAKKYHPDRGQYLSHEIFTIINDLYNN